MKKILLILAFVCTALLFLGCGNSGGQEKTGNMGLF